LKAGLILTFLLKKLIKILSHDYDIEKKLRFLLSKIKELNSIDITECLSRLGGKYKEITENGLRPSLPKTDFNLALAKYLDGIDYVSSIKIHEDKINIYTFINEIRTVSNI